MGPQGRRSCERLVPLPTEDSPGAPLRLRRAVQTCCSKALDVLAALSAVKGLSDNELIYNYQIKSDFGMNE